MAARRLPIALCMFHSPALLMPRSGSSLPPLGPECFGSKGDRRSSVDATAYSFRASSGVVDLIAHNGRFCVGRFSFVQSLSSSTCSIRRNLQVVY